MRLLVRSLLVHVLLMLFMSGLSSLTAQSVTVLPVSPAHELNALLQDYAYKAFGQPKTGISYDATVPSNLTGIRVSAMRLRSGSLKTRGVNKFKEFEIPKDITVSPYVERLVLVYQNLGNWSNTYYDLPGYTYLSPVLGFLAYDAFNLSATNLPELSIQVSGAPIAVHFTNAKSPPSGSVPKCVSINLNGSVAFSSVILGNICLVRDQGHFSVAIESIAPSPSPHATLNPPTSPPKKISKRNTKTWIIAGYAVGGLILFALLVLLVLWTKRFTQKKKMEQMEKSAESGENLRMAAVGDTRAPAAMVTRTRPILENEYAP